VNQVRVYNEDCLSVLERLEEKSVDLIVTDPPYEILDMRVFFDKMLHVLSPKGSIYIFGDKNIVAEHWFSQLKIANKDLLIWYYKNSPNPRGRWRGSMQACIYGYRDGAYFDEDAVRLEYQEATKKLHGRVRPSAGRLAEKKPYDMSKGALPRDVLECPALLGHRSSQRFGHPDQKPLELVERLVRASSREGELVVDPFCGTGTTLVAAKRHGRRAVGCDTNSRWFTVTKERVAAEKRADLS
jgi:site-specific DNA-methyltransferase (adenine-specific)